MNYVEVDMAAFKAFFGSVEKAAKGDFEKSLSCSWRGLEMSS